jgi:steroid 5-alpha reductase family enzyme
MWWGIGLVALSAPFGWIGLIGPAFMNFALVYLTGKANNERKMNKRPAYREYIEKTSGFFPLPPKN